MVKYEAYILQSFQVAQGAAVYYARRGRETMAEKNPFLYKSEVLLAINAEWKGQNNWQQKFYKKSWEASAK
ncbi:hypothetical protein [Heyndrickxia acidiproducens]|jgi:hypothetical protein|uniref:hypothetical protein n=1 Tax=Heyndrickxia acidiproducens TaxID=1121084 RepID=UPI00036E9862|nr:hypothetical protein [Heyndrickxia acidiproducens]